MAKVGLVAGGIVLLVLAVIVYNFPFSESTMGGEIITVTIPVAVGICNSAMGQLGQSFSPEAVKSCSEYNILINGIYSFGLIGIILVTVGAVVSRKKEDKHSDESPYVCEHCDFIGKTEEELWNHYNDKHPSYKKW